MGLVEQWRGIHQSLGGDWGQARLVLSTQSEADARRAAALLGPVNPGRRGNHVFFGAARRRDGPSAETIRRLLARIDAEAIPGTLEATSIADLAPEVTAVRATLAESWDAAVGVLPPDWSDLYAEIELTSSDYLERAALLLAPVNPARFGEPFAFRFRCARRFGYGASPEMVRRCLERLDAESIRGEVRILRVLSDTDPVGTQGPVWYVGGKSV